MHQKLKYFSNNRCPIKKEGEGRVAKKGMKKEKENVEWSDTFGKAGITMLNSFSKIIML